MLQFSCPDYQALSFSNKFPSKARASQASRVNWPMENRIIHGNRRSNMHFITHTIWRVPSRWWVWCAVLLILTMPIGCATRRGQVAEALGTGRPAPDCRETGLGDCYHLACPDRIEIAVAGHPEVGGQFTLDTEGRIDSPALNNLRLDGASSKRVVIMVAHELNVPEENVHCRIVGYESRFITVHGPIEGGDRAIPYVGPETIVDFIRRSGGVLAAADLKEIHVVRGNLALNRQPQIFTVDLQDIFLNGNPQTNIIIEPFDNVWIGELARSKLGKALPKWLRPVYRGFCRVVPALCPKDWSQQIHDDVPQ